RKRVPRIVKTISRTTIFINGAFTDFLSRPCWVLQPPIRTICRQDSEPYLTPREEQTTEAFPLAEIEFAEDALTVTRISFSEYLLFASEGNEAALISL